MRTRHISWFTGIPPLPGVARHLPRPPTTPPRCWANCPEARRYWPLGWYLTHPASFYIAFMFFLSFVLVLPSTLVLRRVAQSTLLPCEAGSSRNCA